MRIPIQYLCVFKVKYLSGPANSWDNAALINNLPTLFDAKKTCLECLKENLDYDSIRDKEPALLEMLSSKQ